VAKGSKWHPKNDDLRGTAKYGTPPTNPTSGPTGTFQWNYGKVQYFMFSTGDFSEWMIVKRNMIDTKFGGPKDQQILCSSDYNTPKMFKQYYRNGANEDPWLSYKHHGTASMMYGENGYNGHSENVQKNGMNVWIYPPPSLKPAGKAFNVNNFCKNWGGKQLKSGDFGSRMFHGLQLVRRVAKGSKWHPKNDDLRGTAKYGTPPTNPTSGPTGTFQWNYGKVQYFMFSTGDFSEWMIVKRNMIDTKFGGPKDQQILCSSDYNTPKMFKQYYRNGANEDPWLSYKHHGTASMMYGENGYNGHSENVQKNGMNVWIYPPQ